MRMEMLCSIEESEGEADAIIFKAPLPKEWRMWCAFLSLLIYVLLLEYVFYVAFEKAKKMQLFRLQFILKTIIFNL